MAEVVRTTRVSLSEDARALAIDCLNHNLANTIFAALAAKHAHWNVKGAGFLPVHRFFDEVATFYNQSADTIAERITALGGNAEGLAGAVYSGSNLDYTANEEGDTKAHMTAMADLMGRIANGYRDGIKTLGEEEVEDFASQDVFIELCREADKLLYFMEADLRSR